MNWLYILLIIGLSISAAMHLINIVSIIKRIEDKNEGEE